MTPELSKHENDAQAYLSASWIISFLSGLTGIVLTWLTCQLAANIFIDASGAVYVYFGLFLSFALATFLGLIISVSISKIGVGAREWFTISALLSFAVIALFAISLRDISTIYAGDDTVLANIIPHSLTFLPLITLLIGMLMILHNWLRRMSFGDPSIDRKLFVSPLILGGFTSAGFSLLYYPYAPASVHFPVVYSILLAYLLILIGLGLKVTNFVPNQNQPRKTIGLSLSTRSVPGKYCLFAVAFGFTIASLYGSYLYHNIMHAMSYNWIFTFSALPILTGLVWGFWGNAQTRPIWSWSLLLITVSTLIIFPHDHRHWLLNLGIWTSFITLSIRLLTLQLQYICDKTKFYRDLFLYLSFGFLLGSAVITSIWQYFPAILLWQKIYFAIALLLLWPTNDYVTPLFKKLMLAALVLATILQFSTQSFFLPAALKNGQLLSTPFSNFYKIGFQGEDYYFQPNQIRTIKLELERHFRTDSHLKSTLHPFDEAITKVSRDSSVTEVGFEGVGSQYGKCFFSAYVNIDNFQLSQPSQKPITSSNPLSRFNNCREALSIQNGSLRNLALKSHHTLFDLIAINIAGSETPPELVSSLEAVKHYHRLLNDRGILIFETNSDISGSFRAIMSAGRKANFEVKYKIRGITGERESQTTQVIVMVKSKARFQELALTSWRSYHDEGSYRWTDRSAQYFPWK